MSVDALLAIGTLPKPTIEPLLYRYQEELAHLCAECRREGEGGGGGVKESIYIGRSRKGKCEVVGGGRCEVVGGRCEVVGEEGDVRWWEEGDVRWWEEGDVRWWEEREM